MVSAGTAARHFLVQDAAPAGHPLHIAGTDQAGIAKAVTVVGGTLEHVGDGLNAPVRVHREAADGTFERVIEGKMVKEQERIKFIRSARGDGATQ